MSFDAQLLLHAAITARENAYAPYSNFAVGAALLAQDGTIYTGCNVECASFGATNCAERTAIYKAVSQGVRQFTAIAVAGGKQGDAVTALTSPCGVCRQVLFEFCGDDFPVIMATSATQYIQKTLGELLPLGFGPDNVQ